MSKNTHARDLDVLVVGAGLSGLIAAHNLQQHGYSVQLLEANDFTGGRVRDMVSAHGHVFSLGATWLGPDEEKLPALMAQLGLQTEAQYETGKIVARINGRQWHSPANESVRIGPFPLPTDGVPDDFFAAIKQLNAQCQELSLDAPYAHPRAAEWDAMTAKDWWQQHAQSETGRTLLRLIIEGLIMQEMGKLSYLYLLFIWRSLLSLIVDDRRIKGGPQQIVDWLTTQLIGRIELHAPVIRIEQDEVGVAVHTTRAVYRGSYAIVAIPPHLCAAIAFDPPMPAARRQLTERIEMGKVIKVILTYERPFWRDAGLSGMIITDEAPLDTSFDTSPEDASGHGVLVGFITGKQAQVWRERPAAERKTTTLHQLTGFFGPLAATPLDYIEQDWLAEPWSGGCYCGVMPPNTMALYGSALRDPVGRIHWAGTETATQWYGSMEGAIASGERAAQAVLDRLESE